MNKINEIDETPIKLFSILRNAKSNMINASTILIMLGNEGNAKGKRKWKGNKNKMLSNSISKPKS